MKNTFNIFYYIISYFFLSLRIKISESIAGIISKGIPGDISAGTAGGIPKRNHLDSNLVTPDEIFQRILGETLGRMFKRIAGNYDNTKNHP